MSGVKYEQLAVKPENDVFTNEPRSKYWFQICFHKGLLSLGLILLYFLLSIGLTFYQRWLLKHSQTFNPFYDAVQTTTTNNENETQTTTANKENETQTSTENNL